jgi:hypothetical protein
MVLWIILVQVIRHHSLDTYLATAVSALELDYYSTPTFTIFNNKWEPWMQGWTEHFTSGAADSNMEDWCTNLGIPFEEARYVIETFERCETA